MLCLLCCLLLLPTLLESSSAPGAFFPLKISASLVFQAECQPLCPAEDLVPAVDALFFLNGGTNCAFALILTALLSHEDKQRGGYCACGTNSLAKKSLMYAVSFLPKRTNEQARQHNDLLYDRCAMTVALAKNVYHSYPWPALIIAQRTLLDRGDCIIFGYSSCCTYL